MRSWDSLESNAFLYLTFRRMDPLFILKRPRNCPIREHLPCLWSSSSPSSWICMHRSLVPIIVPIVLEHTNSRDRFGSGIPRHFVDPGVPDLQAHACNVCLYPLSPQMAYLNTGTLACLRSLGAGLLLCIRTMHQLSDLINGIVFHN